MDVVSVIQIIVGIVSQIPAVGPYIALVLPYLLALPVLVTSFVALWHAVVMFVKGLSAIPGLSILVGIADVLSADEQLVDDFAKGKLLPILSQLSSLPLPKK